MRTSFLFFLCLTGNVFAENPPDMECKVMYLKYIECLWKSPGVNYTFYSKFHDENFRECDTYILKDGLNVGCQRPERDLWERRFNSFSTRLQTNTADKEKHDKSHKLSTKVKLPPPVNLTVQYRSDSNLWFEWRQNFPKCVDSNVRYRVNQNKWTVSELGPERQEYCINLPSNSSLYELQVRSRVSGYCSQSEEWSDWSQPVIWGNHNSTDPARSKLPESPSVWSVVMFAAGGVTLLLFILMLLHHERIRIILIPVVPKPSLVPRDLEEWIDGSKGLKEVFKTNYLERTCAVREFCPLPTSDSEGPDFLKAVVSSDLCKSTDPAQSVDP